MFLEIYTILICIHTPNLTDFLIGTSKIFTKSSEKLAKRPKVLIKRPKRKTKKPKQKVKRLKHIVNTPYHLGFWHLLRYITLFFAFSDIIIFCGSWEKLF